MMTFTSDFGMSDPYVAEVKGVVKACLPEAEIIDITHGIEAGSIAAASFVLAGSYGYFSPSTLHLAVIDPGVGTTRDIIVVETSNYTFIAPDNGILYEAAQSDGIIRIHALDIERFISRLREHYAGNKVIDLILERGVSMTFHGRDLFAPLAAWVLDAFPLDTIACRKESIEKYKLPGPAVSGGAIKGEIIYIDYFGNLITNVKGCEVSKEDEIFIKTHGEIRSAGKRREIYSQGASGYPVALTGSRGFLEISVNGGNAKNLLKAACGDEIIILQKAGNR